MSSEKPVSAKERERVLWIFAAASFFVIFQSYLVAPLIPALTREFGTTERLVGLAVPAYMVPYGVATLFYGPVSDRMGRKKILLLLLGMLAVTTAGTATAQTVGQFLIWRLVGGIASGGVIPIALALLADLYPYQERGRAIGWIFGAIAGGMAFGSTFGVMLNPFLGWRWMMVILAGGLMVVLGLAWRYRRLLEGEKSAHPPHLAVIIKDYAAITFSPRGMRTFSYIFLNAVFHSGIFSWLGLYFAEKYKLSEVGIGLALLGYGIPGMLLGPTIGRLADRVGRRVIIPLGFIVASVTALLLAPAVPLWVAAVAVTLLSFGFDMSHPLLAGIVTGLDPQRRGQALALNAFFLFTGFGLGSLVFEQFLGSEHRFKLAFGVFAGVQLMAGLIGLIAFRQEKTHA